jgi:hypothetical protein
VDWCLVDAVHTLTPAGAEQGVSDSAVAECSAVGVDCAEAEDEGVALERHSNQ